MLKHFSYRRCKPGGLRSSQTDEREVMEFILSESRDERMRIGLNISPAFHAGPLLSFSLGNGIMTEMGDSFLCFNSVLVLFFAHSCSAIIPYFE